MKGPPKSRLQPAQLCGSSVFDSCLPGDLSRVSSVAAGASGVKVIPVSGVRMCAKVTFNDEFRIMGVPEPVSADILFKDYALMMELTFPTLDYTASVPLVFVAWGVSERMDAHAPPCVNI